MSQRPTYKLTLTANQAEVLVKALDLYSRIGIGQFEEVRDVYDRDLKLDLCQRETVRHALECAKLAVGLPVNGGPSIGNQEQVREEFRTAYDIQKAVRHRLAWDQHPEGRPSNVHFDTPIRGSVEGIPEIETVPPGADENGFYYCAKHSHEQKEPCPECVNE